MIQKNSKINGVLSEIAQVHGSPWEWGLMWANKLGIILYHFSKKVTPTY